MQENAYKEDSAENDIETRRLMERLYVLDEVYASHLLGELEVNKHRGQEFD